MNDRTIPTFTGKRIDPLNASLGDIDRLDIAHGLSHSCRFSGQTKYFYSVAAHSIAVAEALRRTGAPVSVVRAALFHDSAEAYLHDLPRTLKETPEFEMYRVAESRLLATIYAALDIPFTEPPAAVLQADDFILKEEALHLLSCEIELPVVTHDPGFVFDKFWILPQAPDATRAYFLRLDDELRGELAA